MGDGTDKKQPPERSAVFSTTDGKKVRIEFDKVFSYVGKTKNHSTTIEYGYSYEKESRETFILDIDFDEFDDKLTTYQKELRDYYREFETSSSY